MVLKKNRSSGGSWVMLLLPVLVGAVLTIGVAMAMSVTDQASFCASCHSMAEAALTHKQSVHAKFACNECHIPHRFPTKYPFKAKEGMRDSFATVTGNVPDLIHPGDETRAVVQENCLRCHGAAIATVNMQSKSHCTDCHRHVPHSPKIPVAKRSAADA